MNFRSGRKRSLKAPPFGSMTASVAGSSRKLSVYRWSSLMLICEKLVAMIGAPRLRSHRAADPEVLISVRLHEADN